MALSFPARNDVEPIDVDAFMAEVKRVHRGNALDTMVEVAESFQHLGANIGFIRGKIVEELRRMTASDRLTMYTPQSMIVHRDEPFMLRMNLWAPLSGSERKTRQESRLFSYDKAHDHNFSLLTVGVAGPGYATRIYEYDVDRVLGQTGERVEIRPLEHTMLPTGKAMIYRPRQDIHIQIPPGSPSVSLNLLVSDEPTLVQPQYFFDTENGILSELFESQVGRTVMLMNFIGYFADDACVTALFDIGRSHAMPSIRSAALRAVRAARPDASDEVMAVAEKDGHPLIVADLRRAAERAGA
jgi:hypothetical protein